MDRPVRERHILSAAVDSVTAYRLRTLAEQSDRTVSQELRRLVRQRIEQAEEADRLRARFQDEQ